jgi:hypothetical protein
MAILFSFFLIYDTQQIMGGKKYSISPEEHIFAAIQVSNLRLLNLQPQRQRCSRPERAFSHQRKIIFILKTRQAISCAVNFYNAGV